MIAAVILVSVSYVLPFLAVYWTGIPASAFNEEGSWATIAGKLGGSGEKFNWDLAMEANKLGRLIFLAGGLTPANVADAVRKVQPYGVDVSSGVEAEPGKKDHGKVREFIKAAKSVETQ